MIDVDTRSTHPTVPVLLVADATERESAPARSLRAALEPVCADGADLELVRADSLAAAATELQARRFAAAFVVASSPATVEAALALGEQTALVVITSAVGEVARLAEDHPHRIVDVLEPSVAPLLAPMKLRACAAAFRTEHELRERLDAARHAAEQQLATVSHDLRNPLNTVILAAQRIELAAEGGPSAPVVQRSVGLISRAVERMGRLVGDLLDLARLDAGQSLPLEPEEVDLAQQLRVAADLIEPLATARRIRVEVQAAGPAPLSCDPERVQQVLANLLGNAVKFTREGGAITVRLTRESDRDVVSVADTGVGIAPEALPQIFTAYWQQDDRRQRGAGLGLAIARAIALAHGGSLDVESTVGVGSTFYFRLPRRAPVPARPLETR